MSANFIILTLRILGSKTTLLRSFSAIDSKIGHRNNVTGIEIIARDELPELHIRDKLHEIGKFVHQLAVMSSLLRNLLKYIYFILYLMSYILYFYHQMSFTKGHLVLGILPP